MHISRRILAVVVMVVTCPFAVRADSIHPGAGAAYTNASGTLSSVRETGGLDFTDVGAKATKPLAALGYRHLVWGPLTLGASVELFQVEMPRTGNTKGFAAPSVEFDVDLIPDSVSEALHLALGVRQGVNFGNNDWKLAQGAYLLPSWQFLGALEVFGRVAFDYGHVGIEGTCHAVSPIATCQWDASTLSGMAWQGSPTICSELVSPSSRSISRDAAAAVEFG